MTITQITKKIESKQNNLKQLRRKDNTGISRKESDLIHDIDLLRMIKSQIERSLSQLNLLKS